MPVETIFDAIQLSGSAPAIGDNLSTSGGDLVAVSDALAFNTAVEGEIRPGDTVDVGGVSYTVSGVTSYVVSATLEDGSIIDTKMYSISLADAGGNTLDYLVNMDPEAVQGAANLPLITQLNIVDTTSVPDGYAIIPLIDENNNVTLSDNTAPDAIDDIAATGVETPVVIDVLANDTDPEGDTLSVVGTPTSPDGTVAVNGDGTITFTPNAGFTGDAVINYTITDGNGGTDSAIVTVTVEDPNTAPDAVDDTAATAPVTPVVIDVLANDTDPEGDTLSVVGTPTSPDGTVAVNGDGTITFTPNAGFTGDAVINYTITDGNGGTDSAIVTVTVEDPNTAPDAVDDTAATAPVTPVVIDVLANDTDPEGDTLSVVGTPTSPDGTVAVNGDGTITFTPNAGFTGDAVINYTITDGNGGTDSAIVTVAVVDTPLDGIVQGGAGDDLIDINYLGDPEGDRIDNDDEILPGEGPNDDIVHAGAGNDTVLAGAGNDDVLGEEGDDFIRGGDGDDILDGGVGNDELFGDAGDDTLLGGDGIDSLTGGLGDDTLDGGAGDDTLFGDEGEDTLTGGDGDDTLRGGDDDDVLDGGDGDDTLHGDDGNDTITGGDGNDTVFGGLGDDIIDTSSGLQRPDIDYPGLYPADTDPFDDRDTVYGGAGNDTIITGDDVDTIFGGTGNDTIDAGVDDDIIDGGDGDDFIVGGEGNDTINGGAGNDTIYAGLDPSFPDGLNIPDDTDLRPNNGQDVVHGDDGDDIIFGADDADILYGDAGNDTIDGGIDDDYIDGGFGDDTLIGGDGNDTMVGGTGNDTFDGGAGDDIMTGGADRDTFTNITAGDTVDGSEDGDDFDTLDLSGNGWAAGLINIVYDAANPENGTVEYLDAAGNITGTMVFTNIENVVPCFTPGTLIATPKGERLVQDLKAGDKIITRDNGIQEISWVGEKKMGGKELASSPHLQPILIRAGALGNGLPERDMLVSPNHRMLVANDKTSLYFEEREVLAAAKHLVNHRGIHAVQSMGTSYIHFMFENHEVVLSDGTWTESFQPGDMSLKGIGNAQRNEILELFPELSTAEGIENFQSARRTLKKHEAQLLVK